VLFNIIRRVIKAFHTAGFIARPFPVRVRHPEGYFSMFFTSAYQRTVIPNPANLKSLARSMFVFSRTLYQNNHQVKGCPGVIRHSHVCLLPQRRMKVYEQVCHFRVQAINKTETLDSTLHQGRSPLGELILVQKPAVTKNQKMAAEKKPYV